MPFAPAYTERCWKTTRSTRLRTVIRAQQ